MRVLDTATTTAAVSAAAHAYEQALVDGDTAAAAGWFDDAATVSRFGPEGGQHGPEAVRALRATTPPAAPATWRREDVTVLADGVVLHVAELDRGATTIQRTQVWRRTERGWRILHAHVSRRSAP
jgi:hypothetical protein